MKFSVKFISGMLLTSLLTYAPPALAEKSKGDAGFVIFAVGSTWRIDHNGQRSELKSGDKIHRGDQLLTGNNGHIHLRMIDQAFIALRPDSALELKTYQFEAASPEQDRARLELKKGSLRSVSGKLADRSKDRYRLNTPVAAIGVRGTDFTVFTTAVESQADVLRGGIAMSPFNSQCTQDSLGPCSGKSVTDLYAAMDQQFLKLRSGDTAPSLLDGRLLKLPTADELNSLKRSLPPAAEDSTLEVQTPAKTNTNNTTTSPKEAETDSSHSLTKADKTSSETPHNTKEANQEDSVSNSKPPIAAQANQTPTVDNDKGSQENTDRDGDGIVDLLDDIAYATDSDSDGIPNNTDPDDDNDGLSDIDESHIGSDPLNADSDGDGVDDGSDTEPTRTDSIVIQVKGKKQQLNEDVFAALTVEKVTLTPVTNIIDNTYYDSKLLLEGGATSIELVRSQTPDGRIFWGTAGSSYAWDKKIQSSLSEKDYVAWASNSGINDQLVNAGASTNAINNRNQNWQSYYDTGSFRPLVTNKELYLSSTKGLQPITPSSIDDPVRYLSTMYWLANANAYGSSPQNQAVRVAHFSFNMQYSANTFSAKIILDVNGESIQALFTGTVNSSGMVFGGKENAYLKGFFINELNELALIFNVHSGDQQLAGTLILNQGGTQAPEVDTSRKMETYQTDNLTAVRWGRWSNFDKLSGPTEVKSVMRSDDLIVAQNEVFALLRSSDNVTLPSEGVFSFDMNSSETVFRRGEQLEVADVIDPSLTIDFNNRDFDTRMRVSSPTLSNGVEVYARGGLGDNGIFTSDSNLSNSEVTGALSDGGRNAGMIFEHTMGNGVISGAIDWRARTE